MDFVSSPIFQLFFEVIPNIPNYMQACQWSNIRYIAL